MLNSRWELPLSPAPIPEVVFFIMSPVALRLMADTRSFFGSYAIAVEEENRDSAVKIKRKIHRKMVRLFTTVLCYHKRNKFTVKLC